MQHKYLCHYLALALMLAAACSTSNWHPSTCEDGLQCPPEHTCSMRDGKPTCIIEPCGNGIRDRGEECEDGNTDDGDGCNADCEFEYCGDAITSPVINEECDDGNDASGDGCTSDCKIEHCGDAMINDSGLEYCDDGNAVSGDGCSDLCQREPRCGDGITDPEQGEDCDCGSGQTLTHPELGSDCKGRQNSDDGGLCSKNCELNCGNGVIDEGEACDGSASQIIFCAEAAGDHDMGIITCNQCMFDTSSCIELDKNNWDLDLVELEGIWGVSTSNILVVGEGDNNDHTVYHFDGTAWAAQDTPSTGKLFALWGDDSMSVALAVGNAGLVLRSNADGTWSQDTVPDSPDLRAVWGSAGNNVFAVGLKGKIYHYSEINNMTAWRNMTHPGANIDLMDIWGSGTAIFAVGRQGTILHYDRDQVSAEWTRMAFPSTPGTPSAVKPVDLTSIWGNGPDDVFAVGRQGMILHYDGNEDKQWTQMPSPTKNTLLDVWGNGPNDVYAAGRAGTLLHYDGNVWAPVRSNMSVDFNAGWSTSTDVFLVGEGNKVYRFMRPVTL